MVGYYKHDIPAWMDGTENLSDGAYRAYHVIVQLIMLNEGPIALNERGLAGRCNQTLKTFTRNLAELLEAGKLILDGGRLANNRAATELTAILANRQNAAKGGKISRKSEKTQETPEKTPANLEKTPADPQSRVDKSLTSHASGEAPLIDDVSLKEKSRVDIDHSEDKPLRDPHAQDDFPRDAFDRWWERQPNKIGKDAARPAFEKIRKARRATFAELMAGMDRYIADKPPTRDWCNPATWLNQGRWKDQPAPPPARAGPPSPPMRAGPKPNAADERAAFLQLVKNGGCLGPSDPSPPDFASGLVIEHDGHGHAHRHLLRAPGADPGELPEEGLPRLAGAERG